MIGLLVSLLLSVAASPPGPAPALPPELDEAALREGLRRRGMTDWLDQYLADVPPPDDADALLRKREKLLSEAERAVSASDRREKHRAAADLIERAIALNPGDSRCLRWRLELVRDHMERVEPEAFEAVLLYETAGRDRGRVSELTVRARVELVALRQAVERAWHSLEILDEAALSRVRISNPVRQLEEIDKESSMLLAWVRLYELVSTPDAGKRKGLAAQLSEDVVGTGWLESSAGQEARRCSALVLATISARLAGQFDEADQYARQIIALLKSSSAAVGAQGSQASLLAVIEQVRALRDSGRLDEALTAARQAAAWSARSRPGDASTAIAMALLECSVLSRQQNKTTAPADFPAFESPVAIAPLVKLLSQGSAMRDAVYHALSGGTTSAEGPPASDVHLQLWAGAMIDAADTSGIAAADKQALDAVANSLDRRLTGAETRPEDSASQVAELTYLLGRASFLVRHYATAVSAMQQLAQKWPQDDRAPSAARSAVAIAQVWLANASPSEQREARDAFVGAVRVWRTQPSSSAEMKLLQFYLGAALEQNEQWSQAADEYAAVDAGDANAVLAALGRARCLRRLASLPMTRPAASQPNELDPILQQSLQSSEQALAAVRSAVAPDSCLVAEAGVSLAGVLNDPRVRRSNDALRALDETEKACEKCAAWQPFALRERLESLRQLGKWSAAREAFARYVRVHPDDAPTLGMSLLDANRQAVLEKLVADDAATARSIAEQAVQLSNALMAIQSSASVEQKARLQLTQAWLLTQAGRAREAISIYDRYRDASPAGLEGEWVTRRDLGTAECLLALGRFAEALPLYTALLTKLPEHSADWWEVYVGTLQCDLQLRSDPNQILQSIRQQKRISPDLGGPRWRKTLEKMESALASK